MSNRFLEILAIAKAQMLSDISVCLSTKTSNSKSISTLKSDVNCLKIKFELKGDFRWCILLNFRFNSLCGNIEIFQFNSFIIPLMYLVLLFLDYEICYEYLSARYKEPISAYQTIN